MNVIVITALSWLALAATAAAQSAPSVKAASPNASQLSQIRSLAHQLQGQTEKLSDLMSQYFSLVEQRPRAQGGTADVKKGNDEQVARWDTAVERLLRRVDTARAAVVETMQRLEQLTTGQLPTTVAKDVTRARNEAVAQRTAAEQALASNKPVLARATKPAKPAPAAEDTSLSFSGDL